LINVLAQEGVGRGLAIAANARRVWYVVGVVLRIIRGIQRDPAGIGATTWFADSAGVRHHATVWHPVAPRARGAIAIAHVAVVA
jgi:hypothetical protein